MKQSPRIKHLFLTLVSVTLGIASSFGQSTFRFQADIEHVSQSGLYKIHLQPTLIAKGKPDLSDLRIINNKKQFTPYSRLQNLPSNTEDFRPFPIISNSTLDSTTTLIIENKNQALLRSIWLNLKNAAVYRTADLLGSDDQQNWFAIQEDISLSQSVNSNTDNFLQSLSFPANSYIYFKIRINNGKKQALKVLQAGVFSNRQTTVAYAELPVPKISQTDSTNKSSYVNIIFADRFLISKLILDVKSPKYYRRQVLIYRFDGKAKHLVGEGFLNSGTRQELSISAKTARLELQIINGDNPPLEINAIRASEIKEYIFAYLEAGNSYHFLVGDDKAVMPEYDLKFFTDSSKSIAEAQHGAIVKNALFKTVVKVEKKNYTLLIWIAILGVLALLSFLSWKMLSEMKTRNSE
jgi:hypothetical protein